MTYDNHGIIPVTDESDAVAWKVHLREIGMRVLRKQDVDICEVRIPDARITQACQRFLYAVDGVTAAVMVADAERRQTSIDAALYDYINAVAWCIGAMLYDNAGDADELLDTMVREVRGARDSLRVLAPSHWNEGDLNAAAERVTRAHIPSGAWPEKFAHLSFTYVERAVQAA